MKFEVVAVTLNPAIDRTLTIRGFAAGRVNRVEEDRTFPGGKGINVAAALADYGFHVAAAGFLGRENAAVFETFFDAKGIADFCVRIAGETRLGIKIADPSVADTTDINLRGPAPTAADIEAMNGSLAALEAKWFVLAGSLPQGVDAAIYRRLIAVLKERGARVALDASGRPLELSLDAAPHLIKPNIHELESLLGKSLASEAAVLAAARELTARGVETVVVSMGRGGACVATAAEAVIVRPPQINILTTAGAGDAMVAGMVAGRLRELPLADCAKMATAFSFEAITRFEPGISSARAIEDSMATVTVEPVNS